MSSLLNKARVLKARINGVIKQGSVRLPIEKPICTVIRKVRRGDMCDRHPTRSAIVRFVYSDEYESSALGCEKCLAQVRAEKDQQSQKIQCCEWCHQNKIGVKPFKDREGNRDNISSNVCPDCRSAYIQKQLTNDFIPGRRKTRQPVEEVVSEESFVDNNDDNLEDDE